VSTRTRHRWLVEKPFAHRGLHGEGAPENTLEAFSRAVEAGFPIELDVLRSADGRAVVFHDANLLRLTGVDKPVAQTGWPELAKLRVAGTDSRIPLLEAVLELVNGRVGILAELKVRHYSGAVEATVGRALAGYPGPVAVQSFNPFTLAWFRLRRPDIPRGQLSCVFDTDPMASWKKAVLAVYGMNWLTGPHFIAHQLERLPSPATSLLKHFLPVLAWTVRSPDRVAKAREVADNYIFEGFLPGAADDGIGACGGAASGLMSRAR
jgi:glycerophosphoryl diester phosphodiesterase